MEPNSKVLDRCRGSLLGLAVGDALGVTHERFLRRPPPKDPDLMPDFMAEVQADTIAQRQGISDVEMVGGGPWQRSGLTLAPGEWTDDTSMALCIADCMLQQGGALDPHALMAKFCSWVEDAVNASVHHNGTDGLMRVTVGLGGIIGTSIARFKAQWQSQPDAYREMVQRLAAQREWPDDSQLQSGNGAIMRMAPAALYWHDDAAKAQQAARLQAATTHATSEAIDAAAAMADVIVRAVNGGSKEQLLTLSAECAATLCNADVAELFAENAAWRSKAADDIITLPGRCLWSLEAALWALHNTDSFEEAVAAAVKLGGDADTVGAITGQLAGALYGEGAIPQRWLEKLAYRQEIAARASALCCHGQYDAAAMDIV